MAVLVSLWGLAACGLASDITEDVKGKDSKDSLIEHCAKRGHQLATQYNYPDGYTLDDRRQDCQESYENGDFRTRAELDVWMKLAEKLFEEYAQ